MLKSIDGRPDAFCMSAIVSWIRKASYIRRVHRIEETAATQSAHDLFRFARQLYHHPSAWVPVVLLSRSNECPPTHQTWKPHRSDRDIALLRLSFELRLQIYRRVGVLRRTRNHRGNAPAIIVPQCSRQPDLALVSRQLREDVLSVFYGELPFVISVESWRSLHNARQWVGVTGDYNISKLQSVVFRGFCVDHPLEPCRNEKLLPRLVLVAVNLRTFSVNLLTSLLDYDARLASWKNLLRGLHTRNGGAAVDTGHLLQMLEQFASQCIDNEALEVQSASSGRASMIQPRLMDME